MPTQAKGTERHKSSNCCTVCNIGLRPSFRYWSTQSTACICNLHSMLFHGKCFKICHVHMYMCHLYVCSSQEAEFNTLRLVVVSYLTWVLETKLGPCERASSTVDCWTSSPVPMCLSFRTHVLCIILQLTSAVSSPTNPTLTFRVAELQEYTSLLFKSYFLPRQPRAL